MSVMRLKTFNSGEATRGGKRLALAFALAAALGGCDTMSALNPFDRPEVYKPEVTPEVPADKLYNEGLARLQNGDTEGANKKFEEIDKQAPFSPYSKRGLIILRLLIRFNPDTVRFELQSMNTYLTNDWFQPRYGSI